MAPLDPTICYRALVARDQRFDGRFFVGVTSTGVYCRPVCPARTAGRARCRFFMSAAAAQEAGFRPCLRCRPETAPQAGAWRGTSNTVARGLDLIATGELDGDDAGVDHLADRLGVGARHLRRLFDQHLGASPVAVAQTRRVLFAKQLIHDTRLPMSEIAFAAGFGSIRRFNEIFRQLYDRTPGALRRKAVVALPEGSAASVGVTVHLRYRPPYDWAAILDFLRGRALTDVESVGADSYARTFQENGVTGTVHITQAPRRNSLAVRVRCTDVRVLPRIVNRVRRVFDLGADVDAIGAHLARDPLLAPLVAARPGLRVPGGWDGFEVGMRAVLGQQVSVTAARALVSRLVQRCGDIVATAPDQDPGLSRVFPTPEQVVHADLSRFGVPNARTAALVAVAQAASADPQLFQPRAAIEDTVARLRTIPGVGDWTAHYVALRGAREPDAFPEGDAGLQRTFTRLASTAGEGDGARKGDRRSRALVRQAEHWRPWRAYAAQHLWAADSGALSNKKETSLATNS